MANLEQHVSVYSQALNLRTQRHQVLASNIANADTPNYKARDFNFTTAMQNALSRRAQVGGIALATTSAGHISGGSGGGGVILHNTTLCDVTRANARGMCAAMRGVAQSKRTHNVRYVKPACPAAPPLS